MLHACAARFDVTGNLEKFCELNKASHQATRGGAGSSPQVRRPQRTGSQQPLARANRCRDMTDRSTPDAVTRTRWILRDFPKQWMRSGAKTNPNGRRTAPQRQRQRAPVHRLRLIIVLRPGPRDSAKRKATRRLRPTPPSPRLAPSRPWVNRRPAGPCRCRHLIFAYACMHRTHARTPRAPVNFSFFPPRREL